MKRFLVICLQSAVFIMIYSVWCQDIEVAPINGTNVINSAYHNHKNDIQMLRQGISNDESNPYNEKTLPTPKHECVCSKIYDPVCASNNESYFNLCLLECKVPKSDNVTVVHQGNCIPF